MKNILIILMTLSAFTYSMTSDDPLIVKTSIHSLEYRMGEENINFLEAEVAMGYDLRKLIFKTELEQVEEKFTKAQTRLLYSIATDPYWNFQIGIRKDFEENGKEYASIGIDGLYPYYINTEAVLFVATDGLVEAKLTLEHEMMITQKAALMVGTAISAFSKNEENSGFASSESFVKLMYGITKKFIPYVGIVFEDSYFRDKSDEPAGELFYTVGLHAWF